MLCPKCGRESENLEICEHCGASLQGCTEKKKKGNASKVKTAGIIAGLVASAAIICLAMFIGARNKKYDNIIKTAKTYLDKGDYEQAKATYDDAITIEPKNQDGYIGRANSQLAQNQMTEAAETLKDAANNTNNNNFSDSAAAVEKYAANEEDEDQEDSDEDNYDYDYDGDQQIVVANDGTIYTGGDQTASTQQVESEDSGTPDAQASASTTGNQMISTSINENELYQTFVASRYGEQAKIISTEKSKTAATEESYPYVMSVKAEDDGLLEARVMELGGGNNIKELVIFHVVSSSDKKAKLANGIRVNTFARQTGESDAVPAWIEMQVFAIEEGKVKEITNENDLMDYPVSSESETEAYYYSYKDNGTTYLAYGLSCEENGEVFETFEVKGNQLVCASAMVKDPEEQTDQDEESEDGEETDEDGEYGSDDSYESE